MKHIRLDTSGWSSPDEFYQDLLPRLGAPDWHGRNLDALYDSLGGGANRLDPPFRIDVHGSKELGPEMLDFLQKVCRVFDDARQEFGADVSLNLR